jgi:hypothetical protein
VDWNIVNGAGRLVEVEANRDPNSRSIPKKSFLQQQNITNTIDITRIYKRFEFFCE